MEVTDAPSSRSFWIPLYVELFGSDHPYQAVAQTPG